MNAMTKTVATWRTTDGWTFRQLADGTFSATRDNGLVQSPLLRNLAECGEWATRHDSTERTDR